MVLVLDRTKFKNHFEKLIGDVSSKSPLWVPEQRTRAKCSHFLFMPSRFSFLDMWAWAEVNMRGKVMCFSLTHDNEAWWGFTEESDIDWFILKWS